jgi:hypothetical protein
MNNNDKLLNDLYYANLNFDGVDNLFKKAKEMNKNINRKEVEEFLKNKKPIN